jgi:hypothetical protein
MKKISLTLTDKCIGDLRRNRSESVKLPDGTEITLNYQKSPDWEAPAAQRIGISGPGFYVDLKASE